MGCHIETPQSGPWKGGTLIMCGEAFDPPKPCKFCGDDGLYLCDWKEVERVEDTHWHDVRVGDVWVINQRLREAAVTSYIHGRVTDIVAESRGLKFLVESAKGIQPYFRFFNSTSSCPILRRGTCDQPVCERHAREVGDDVHYCMDCWQRQAALIGGVR